MLVGLFFLLLPMFGLVVTSLMKMAYAGIRQNSLGVMMVDLKTVIDCLNWKLEDGS
jgi:hypothetical protein